MNIKRFNKRGLKKFEFINRSAWTRNGFKHETILFENNIEIASATMHYLNRTWENYQFQSVMLKAVGVLLDNKKEEIKENYKTENNIKRITEAKRKELEKIIEKNKRIKKLKKLRDEIRGNIY